MMKKFGYIPNPGLFKTDISIQFTLTLFLHLNRHFI